MSVRFTQSCPTCGRRIQVRASLIGSTIACQHCKAEFVAQNGSTREAGSSDNSTPLSVDPLMARVEQALERAQRETAAL